MLKCLAPIVGPNTRVLILGSFPGTESLARQEYYAHKTNRFWPICAGPAAYAGALSYKKKIRALQKRRLGLWDVIGSCRRAGSSDNNIKNPEFNDILTLLKAFRKLRERATLTERKKEDMEPLMRKYLIILLFCMILPGCASLPVHKGTSYSLDDIYKRLDYKIDGDYRVVDIFYATSRQAGTSKLADETTYGTLDIRIDPRVRIGAMLPDQLKKKGIIELQKTKKLDPAAFTKQLSEAVQASPHKSLLVLVFGYKDGFEATAMKAAYFAYLLDVDTPVLLFDWPGDQPVSIGGYVKAQSLAAASGPHLAEVLAKVVREVKPEKLWIEASSLGCQVACDAFDKLYTQSDFADKDIEIDHVILAAPDISSNDFDKKFKDEFAAMSKKLTAYVSSDDDALLMSGIIDGEKKLGRTKLRVKDPGQLEEARGLLYLKSLDPERFMMIDVTAINNASFKHGYYLECPEFYDDFYMRIFDTRPGVNRHLYLLKYSDGTDYWVMQGSK
jgi:hypoxanthine-DNA glycosylase